jgi:putative oxidoreductase
VHWVFGNATTFGVTRWALVPLRLMLAAIFLVHGSQKAFGLLGATATAGPGGWANTVTMIRDNMHFPAPALFAALLIASELGGGLLLLLGLAPRIGAFAGGMVMVIGILTVHWHQGFLGTHLQQMILLASVTIMIGGSGALSLSPGSDLPKQGR